MTLNSGYVYKDRVRPAHAGASVLDYHAARFPHSTSDVWTAALAEGRVRVNGRTASAEDRLATGDALEYHRLPWSEPEVPLAFEVAYEDDHLIVVAKPAGLQVLPAGPFLQHTLLSQVRASAPWRAQSSPIHRLGRGTSGLIVFGTSEIARAELARQFRCFEARKTYLALALGCALPPSAVAEHPIGRLAHGRLHIHVAREDGKPSRTRVRVLRRDPARDLSLVAAQPITGRPDQIRIHLAALGAPIFGDPLFGPGGVPKSRAMPGDGGYFLHAAALAFRHPVTREFVRLHCLPPWLSTWSSP